MSRFVVDLNNPHDEEKQTIVSEKQSAPDPETPTLTAVQKPKKRSGCLRILGLTGIVLAIVLVIAGIGSYFYWQSVKKTPAYSLALVVDAARRDDKAQMAQVVDTEAVIDDFMPQVTAKAIELYGRNLPPATITKVTQAATPLLPAVKDRARVELPRVIREKTAPVERVPYWLIALGADRAVDIAVQNDTATVKSKIADRQLDLTMKRDGDHWKIVALKDDVLAQKIAEKIGQDLIAFATKNGVKKAGEEFGVKNADELLKSVQNIFK